MRKVALLSAIIFFVTFLVITGFFQTTNAQVNGCYNLRDGTFRILIGSDQCKKGEQTISLYTKENVDALVSGEATARLAGDEDLQSQVDDSVDVLCNLAFSHNIPTPFSLCLGRPNFGRLVFISSQTYSGNLGGLLGADAKCQELAEAAGFIGTFKAWLSDSTTNASYRLTHSYLGYGRVDGVKVADDWSDLVDGSLDAPINVTETGQLLTGDTTTWTGTNTNGVKYPATTLGGQGYCYDWTNDEYSNNNNARYGWGNFPPNYPYIWTIIYNGEASCAGVRAHLYCFQQ